MLSDRSQEEQFQEFRESLVSYEGRTAKDRWLTACAAFLNLRHRVLAKWKGELHQERNPDQDYWLCRYICNLSVDNQTYLLGLRPAQEWDEAMELCDQLSAWYASEIREFRILLYRAHTTFTPFRKSFNQQQHAQMMRAMNYFVHGEEVN